jgi:membrane fusion protein (multidrug efflux system)
MQKSATEPEKQAPPASVPAVSAHTRRRFSYVVLVALIGPLAAAATGAYLYFASGRFVSTDNAYVKAHKIAVSADVAGRVSEVHVDADQVVAQGTLLFRIDPQPLRIALDRAEAQLAAAVQEAHSLRALYDQKVARLKLAEGDLAFQRQHYERQDTLTKTGVVSRSLMDTAERALRNATDQVAIAHQEIAEVLARLGGDNKRAPELQPSVREAQAIRDRAAWDLERTEVRAPVAGIVTNFDLQPGAYVTAGSVVFSMVGSESVWVQANFKETDLTNVRPGQRAIIHIDMYPDKVVKAVVSSISPATGAEFALLPPQNATGNWVKVVQRLPVRLKLDLPPGSPALRAGMSAVVDIDTEFRRPVPGWVQSLLGWAGTASGSEREQRSAIKPETKR